MHHELTSGSLSVKINSKGAELSSIRSKNGTEYIWQADPAVWARHAPVLFPIVGRLRDGSYEFQETRYELPQHGFARDRMFELLEGGTSHCRFELRGGPETLRNYPFDFVLSTDYSLSDRRLTISHQVTNPADQELFFGLGAHPGFNCPLHYNERFEDYYLEFEEDDYQTTLLKDGLRTDDKRPLRLHNRRLFLNPSVFDHDALVFENAQIDRIRLCSALSGPVLSLECRDWPFFGIWAKKGSRQFVCLEPWYGVTDHVDSKANLAEKTNMIRLGAGEAFTCSYSITIH